VVSGVDVSNEHVSNYENTLIMYKKLFRYNEGIFDAFWPAKEVRFNHETFTYSWVNLDRAIKVWSGLEGQIKGKGKIKVNK